LSGNPRIIVCNLHIWSKVLLRGSNLRNGAGQFFLFRWFDPIITLSLGSFATDPGMVLGYFFEASKSSADKTKLMSKMIADK